MTTQLFSSSSDYCDLQVGCQSECRAVADLESRVGGFLSGLRAKRAENFYRPRPLFLNHALIYKPAMRTVGCNTMTGSAGGKLLEQRLIEFKN